MVEMNKPTPLPLIEAVRIWTGWGQSLMPTRNDKRLVEHFGEEVSAKLLVLIKSLEEDFYTSDARLVAANLPEMETLASEQFRRRHPMVADDIVKAFAWCYAFDFK
jgi:hypothetical protein